MGYKYEHLMRLTANELHNHCERLRKKGVNELLIADIKRTVLDNKAHRKSHRAHLKQVHNQWRVIMSPSCTRRKPCVRSATTRTPSHPSNAVLRLRRMPWCLTRLNKSSRQLSVRVQPRCNTTRPRHIGQTMCHSTSRTECVPCSMRYRTTHGRRSSIHSHAPCHRISTSSSRHD